MRRIAFLSALLHATVSIAGDSFASIADFAVHLQARGPGEVRCATYPATACDPRQTQRPPQRQLALVYLESRTTSPRQAQLFLLREKLGAYELLEASPLFSLEGGKGFALNDLEIISPTHFRVGFAEGISYFEEYTFGRSHEKWRAERLDSSELGRIDHAQTDEFYVGVRAKSSVNFVTGIAVSRRANENGKWKPPTHRRFNIPTLLLTNFSLDHDFRY